MQNVELNQFNFIGIVYEDAVAKEDSKGMNVCHFAINVNCLYGSKTAYIPIQAIYLLFDKCMAICYKGNKVAVSGEILTRENFDRESGTIQVQVFFLAKSIYLIQKAEKKEIDMQAIPKLINIHSLTSYISHLNGYKKGKYDEKKQQ